MVAVESRGDRCDLRVRMESGELARAVAYPSLTGPVVPGARVLLNTTAVRLSLGTGGRHFVLAVEGAEAASSPGPGHVVKWRYLPWQRAFPHVEEEGGAGHEVLRDASSLGGVPVVALGLHSELAPAVAGILAERPGARVAYVHTDGGSLAVAFSDTVRRLRSSGALCSVLSCGQAFGGDHECVGLPSALLAARLVERAEVVVCGMGPGIVGTGTRLGHTGTEQAFIAQAAAALGGRALVVPRLSASDGRSRHRGLSHHTLAVLEDLVQLPVVVPWPRASFLPRAALARAEAAWRASRAAARHLRVEVPLRAHWQAAEAAASWSSMGRGVDEDPLPYAAPLAAGILAARLAGLCPSLPA